VCFGYGAGLARAITLIILHLYICKKLVSFAYLHMQSRVHGIFGLYTRAKPTKIADFAYAYKSTRDIQALNL